MTGCGNAMSDDKSKAYEAYLVAAARTGDRRAADHLVRRWTPMLWRYAYRMMGDSEMTADVVQESWAAIWPALPRLRDEQAFAAWALRIVARRCARQIAGLKGARHMRHALAAEMGTDAGSAVTIEQPDRGMAIRQGMAALPAGHRTMIGLYYDADMSVDEIARATGVSVGTVKSRLFHARRKLRAILQGDDE